jgi:hypothetical protein
VLVQVAEGAPGAVLTRGVVQCVSCRRQFVVQITVSHAPELGRGNHPESCGCVACLNTRKTHCERGHELTGANLHLTRTGGRECVKCRRERRLRHDRKRRAA